MLQLRGSARLLFLAVVFILVVYIPLNLLYVMLSTVNRSSSTAASVSSKDGEVALTLKQVLPQSDGTVDLVMNLNVHDLIKVVDNQKVPDYGGEQTDNPLPANFSFVLNKPDYCSTDPTPTWIIYVHTAPGNVERRELLRSTWANNKLFSDGRTKTIFMVGTPKTPADQEIINKEFDQYGDMVQGSFVEDYKNLTIKGIMGLRWVAEFCPQAKYALKADDDAFVNLFALMPSVVGRTPRGSENVIACPLWKDNTMPILRDPKKCMKWCVKYSEFPGRSHFPRYCAGLAFVLSQSVVPQMYKASKSTPFFWIDDVYVTGLLAGKVKNVDYIDYLPNFTLKEALAHENYLSTAELKYYFSHVKKKDNFNDIWNATLHRLDKKVLKEINPEVLKPYPDLLKKSKM